MTANCSMTPRGMETWSADLPGSGLAYAAMLVTRNLILANREHAI